MTTAPTDYAVSVCEVKNHCRIDTTDEDTTVASLIQHSTDYVQRASGRQLTKATYTTTIEDGFPIEIPLDHSPVYSVTSIQYYDVDGDIIILAADQYTLVNYGLVGKIVPAYGVTWPACRNLPNSVEVLYVAGSDVQNIPLTAKRAILLIIGHWHENREAIVTGTISGNLPIAIESLIYQLSLPEVL